jgi:hypothetical protein
MARTLAVRAGAAHRTTLATLAPDLPIAPDRPPYAEEGTGETAMGAGAVASWARAFRPR